MPSRSSHFGNLYSHALLGSQLRLLYDHLHDTSPNSSTAGHRPAAMHGKPELDELPIAAEIFSHVSTHLPILKQICRQLTPPSSPSRSSSSASLSTTLTSLSHKAQPALSPRPRRMAQPSAPTSLMSPMWREKASVSDSRTHGGGSGMPMWRREAGSQLGVSSSNPRTVSSSSGSSRTHELVGEDLRTAKTKATESRNMPRSRQAIRSPSASSSSSSSPPT